MSEQHEQSRSSWSRIAGYWDAKMGEGNDFVDILIWPAVQRLLGPVRGRRVLDVACGNGLYARRLSDAGATVVAVDFAEEMIHAAVGATRDEAPIDYLHLDATDPEQLTTLGDPPFDAAVCLMALMDISDHRPLLAAVPALVPTGPFVIAISHPAFNSPHVRRSVDADGRALATSSSYMSAQASADEAIRGQPVPHPHFHRSLSELLAPAFEAGLVLDALEERAFPASHATGTGANPWGGSYSEFPAVLLARLRTDSSDVHF